MSETNNNLGQVSPEEENLAEQIRELLADGHSGKDIIAMGYKESTVRQEARKWAKRNSGKVGNGNSKLPVKLAKGDTIPIESELEGIRLQDGDYRVGFIDGLRVLVLGCKLSQMLTANLAETTSSQLALLKEAKSDSKDVAEETLARAIPYIQNMIRESAIAASPNPLAGMMQRLFEPFFQNMFGGMFGRMLPQQGQTRQPQPSLPPGWEYAPKSES